MPKKIEDGKCNFATHPPSLQIVTDQPTSMTFVYFGQYLYHKLDYDSKRFSDTLYNPSTCKSETSFDHVHCPLQAGLMMRKGSDFTKEQAHGRKEQLCAELAQKDPGLLLLPVSGKDLGEQMASYYLEDVFGTMTKPTDRCNTYPSLARFRD